MGAIVIRTRYDEGTESAEVATSDFIAISKIWKSFLWRCVQYACGTLGCVHNCTSGENVDLTIGYQRYYC